MHRVPPARAVVPSLTTVQSLCFLSRQAFLSCMYHYGMRSICTCNSFQQCCHIACQKIATICNEDFQTCPENSSRKPKTVTGRQIKQRQRENYSSARPSAVESRAPHGVVLQDHRYYRSRPHAEQRSRVAPLDGKWRIKSSGSFHV